MTLLPMVSFVKMWRDVANYGNAPHQLAAATFSTFAETVSPGAAVY